MIIVTTEHISNRNFLEIGIVQGSTIQTKNFVHDLGQSLKTFVGGELKSYNDMMQKARDIATKRMIEEAEVLKADAIVGVRYSSSSIMQGASEILVYGTAVKFLE